VKRVSREGKKKVPGLPKKEVSPKKGGGNRGGQLKTKRGLPNKKKTGLSATGKLAKPRCSENIYNDEEEGNKRGTKNYTREKKNGGKGSDSFSNWSLRRGSRWGGGNLKKNKKECDNQIFLLRKTKKKELGTKSASVEYKLERDSNSIRDSVWGEKKNKKKRQLGMVRYTIGRWGKNKN